MIPLVEILMILLCITTNHFKEELLFSAKLLTVKTWVYLSGIDVIFSFFPNPL